jgi:hypothetical protein
MIAGVRDAFGLPSLSVSPHKPRYGPCAKCLECPKMSKLSQSEPQWARARSPEANVPCPLAGGDIWGHSGTLAQVARHMSQKTTPNHAISRILVTGMPCHDGPFGNGSQTASRLSLPRGTFGRFWHTKWHVPKVPLAKCQKPSPFVTSCNIAMLVAVPRGAPVTENGQKWPEMALHLTNYCL